MVFIEKSAFCTLNKT